MTDYTALVGFRLRPMPRKERAMSDQADDQQEAGEWTEAEERFERVFNNLLAERQRHARHRRESAEEVAAWRSVSAAFETQITALRREVEELRQRVEQAEAERDEARRPDPTKWLTILPPQFREKVDAWLKSNDKQPTEVRFGLFPLGMVGRWIERAESAEQRVAELETPIPMILYCPQCQWRHVDEDEWKTKPHKTHLCNNCGHEWRPSDRATVGVYALTNKEHDDA